MVLLESSGLHSPPADAVAAKRAELHLDDALPLQYLNWLSGAIHGDFGRSFRSYTPVVDLYLSRIGATRSCGSTGRDVPVDSALALVYGYAAGLDMTRRDLQIAARDAGRPWDWGKGFDQSAPCGPIRPLASGGHPTGGRIWLKVNGATRQSADLTDLIWSVPEVIAFASRAMLLQPGDRIYTGTPAGVGPVVPGDRLHGGIDGIGEIEIAIAVPTRQ